MSLAADAKHYAALFLLAVGGFGALGGLSGLIMTATAWVDAKNPNADNIAMGFTCSAVGGLVGLWMFRRGLRVRRKAIAEGSTAHLPNTPQGGGVHTTRSGSPRPSFLEGPKDDDPRLDHRGRRADD